MDVREIPSGAFRRHPWEVTRLAFFSEIVAGSRPRRILDVGAGDGWFAAELAKACPSAERIVCWDTAYGPDDVAARRAVYGDPRLEFTSERPAGRHDLLLFMDVLEHVADDAGFLRQVIDHAAAGDATVVVSVPAWPILYGNHDLALRHFRRYSPARLRGVLEGAGLEIVRGGGLFHSLVVPRFFANLVDDYRTTSIAWRGGELGARLLTAALRVDNALSRLAASAGVALPGLTTWALCRRR